MNRLTDTTTIYFLAGAEPTEAELQEIQAIEGSVTIMRGDVEANTLYGAGLRSSDYVAGTVPTAYNGVAVYDGIASFGGAPAMITDLSATPGDTEVVLAWTAPNDIGDSITDYDAQYRVAGTDFWTLFEGGTTTSTGLTVTGLTNGTTYEFQVRATNSNGDSPWSGTITATPSA